MNDILNSEDFADFCENYNCDEDCPLFLYKSSNGTGYSCSSRFYKIKFEAEKAKVEKLKKCVEHYASLEHNSEAITIDYDGPSFFFDSDDISTEIWHGKDHNGVERIHKGRYYGKIARQTLKEIGE